MTLEIPYPEAFAQAVLAEKVGDSHLFEIKQMLRSGDPALAAYLGERSSLGVPVRGSLLDQCFSHWDYQNAAPDGA